MSWWRTDSAVLLPCILVVWSSASFIANYIFAVLEGHVVPFVPYISDTGTCPPESGLFGFTISVTAMLGAATMYIRYKIVKEQEHSSSFLCTWFNIISLFVGVTGCIGMGIVASFQETLITDVHDVGALVTFVFGVLYTLLQSFISYKSCPQWNSRGMCHIRMAISGISFVALVLTIICASFDGGSKYTCDVKPEPNPYRFASAVCEWVVAFGFVFYFLTFVRDFQAVTLTITTEIHRDF